MSKANRGKGLGQYDFELTLQANRHLRKQETCTFKEKILAYKNDPIIEVKGHME